MPLTGAERARLYRQRKKENPHEYAAYLQKEKKRYHKRKVEGQIRSINDMTEREKRHTRKAWRKKKQKERNERKRESTELQLETPPSTPSGPFPINLTNAGRKKVRKDRAKAYREIKKLKDQIADQKRTIERYKKRLYRQKLNSSDTNSPRTQTRTLLKGQKVTNHTRRILLFHHVFLKGLKEKYSSTRSERKKQILTKSLTTSLLKKYRMIQMARKSLNLTQRRQVGVHVDSTGFIRRKKKNSIAEKMQTDIQHFLCREDNSRMKPGKKATRTKNKDKRQIYLLNDSMKNLHLKFLAENKDRKLSYSLFCQLKPFFVRQPNEKDRETCLCKRHENLQYKANKLKQMKLIDTCDLDDLASQITCQTENKDCMYRTCNTCKNKSVTIGAHEIGKMVEWLEWKTKKLEKTEPNGEVIRTYSITVRETERGAVGVLIDEFQDDLKKMTKHLFNIKHQYKAIRKLKEKLTNEDILVHVDFSENYMCKYSEEIQSMHFGASQRQISLHTGVVYTASETIPFCSISDNLKHGPAAIWTHLRPVLTTARAKNSLLTNLYFLSDGPTTQYRNKENFYLMSTTPFEMGFKTVNWNFSEAGHGKGAPDGVGAVVKREADRAVSHGKDIINAKSLYDILQAAQVSLKLYLIPEEEISAGESKIDSSSLKSIPGTLKIHQVCFCLF